MKVTVIDYGLSNLRSIYNALTHIGAEPEVVTEPESVMKARALVLPGVGAFGDGMEGLKARGLDKVVRERTEEGIPLLGICLGMQMLFDRSEEFGLHEGLGLIPGTVIHIPQYGAGGSPIRAPHISWEPLAVLDRPEQKASAVLRGLSAGAECYFIHSYAAVPKDPADCLAEVLYDGMPVCAAAAKGNVIGTQFHPEKSGEVGLQILRNYLSFCTETEGA